MSSHQELQSKFRLCPSKPQVFIISDIANEPDDAESLVRYLLYSNELDTLGLVACTSTHMKTSVHPQDMRDIIHAYALVADNLNAHVHPENQYPSAEKLLSIVRAGPPVYGMEALEDGVELSEGAALLVSCLEDDDNGNEESRPPLWVLCWGGTNVLAQALQHLQRSQSPQSFARQRARLRVYAISDQDDTGAWIRLTFPDIFYICSLHGWNEYGCATWTGISGEQLSAFDIGGPDFTKVSKTWLRENIQRGQLGRVYPDYSFIMEGDTPSFLYLIQNGLGSSEHPEWGSWGGRYTLMDVGGRAARHYADARDQVVGMNGQMFRSNQATIWRWRDHFQDSFAARMQWTLSGDPRSANHAPVVIVNDSTPGPEPVMIEAEAGMELVFDATRSYDPDGDALTFTWFQYKEPTSAQSLNPWPVPDVALEPDDPRQGVMKVRLPRPEQCAVNFRTGEALQNGMVLHFVLQVTDSGSPPLTTYKRMVVQTTNPELLGGRGKAVDTFAEALGEM